MVAKVITTEAPVFTERTCPRCEETKALDEFYATKWAQNKEHVSTYCKSCTRERTAERKAAKFAEVVRVDAEWRARPDVKHRKAIRDRCRKYNITEEQFYALWDAQDGLCAIGFEALEFGKGLCVDHDHKTGVVRALLCGHCNLMLGHAREDIGVLNSAISYLERHHATV